jgi:hypothetical protein
MYTAAWYRHLSSPVSNLNETEKACWENSGPWGEVVPGMFSVGPSYCCPCCIPRSYLDDAGVITISSCWCRVNVSYGPMSAALPCNAETRNLGNELACSLLPM